MLWSCNLARFLLTTVFETTQQLKLSVIRITLIVYQKQKLRSVRSNAHSNFLPKPNTGLEGQIYIDDMNLLFTIPVVNITTG